MKHFTFHRRLALAAAAAGLLAALPAHAQGSWPDGKPIKIIVPYGAGGSVDAIGRTLAQELTTRLNTPVVVENRTGAGSNVGSTYVAKAPPDGHTLLLTSPGNAINVTLFKQMPYDVRTELTQVAVVGRAPGIALVKADSPINSVKDLVAAAKKDPEKLNYSTSGNGSAPHLGAALFSQLTGARMTHVPYRGGSLAIQSVMAGDTQLTFGTSPSVLPMASGGRLRAIAVSTRERSPLVPDLPGMREAGLPEYHLEFWYGVFLPAATPPAIAKKIFDATVTAMQQPAVKSSLAREGTEVSVSASPEQFASFLVEDGKFWVGLVRSANVKVD